jgi:hypothetical protein
MRTRSLDSTWIRAAWLAVLAAPSPAFADPCRGIELAGDARGVAMIEPLLHDADTEGCPNLRIRVGWREGALDIVIEDATGVLGERIIGDAAAAAAWIDSWVRPDLASNLLAVRASSPPDPDRTPRARAYAPASVTRRKYGSIDSHGEAALGDDGSRWLGVAAAAHRTLGPVVTGVVARYSSQATAAGQGELATTTRWEAETLLAVDLPIPIGPSNFALGIAAGGGIVRSARTASTTTLGPRVEAHAACSLPLGHAIAAELMVAGGAAPGAPTAAYRRDGAMYPAEPATLLRLAIGLRVELP